MSAAVTHPLEQVVGEYVRGQAGDQTDARELSGEPVVNGDCNQHPHQIHRDHEDSHTVLEANHLARRRVFTREDKLLIFDEAATDEINTENHSRDSSYFVIHVTHLQKVMDLGVLLC